MNLDDADRYIYMKGGTLVYESVFEKQFTGDFKRLLNCVEDSIFDDKIDWNLVKRDYGERLL